MIQNTVALTIPADQSMMLVMRMTTAGVMARIGLTVEAVDDLKMAVEEACNCLLMQDGAGGMLRLTYRSTVDRVVTTVCTEGEGGHPIDADTLGVIRCILESMVDAVSFQEKNGCVQAIDLIKRLPKQGHCA